MMNLIAAASAVAKDIPLDPLLSHQHVEVTTDVGTQTTIPVFNDFNHITMSIIKRFEDFYNMKVETYYDLDETTKFEFVVVENNIPNYSLVEDKVRTAFVLIYMAVTQMVKRRDEFLKPDNEGKIKEAQIVEYMKHVKIVNELLNYTVPVNLD